MKLKAIAVIAVMGIALAQDVTPTQAQEQLNNKDYAAAAKSFESLIATDYKISGYHMGLGLAAFGLTDYVKAEFEFATVVNAEPDNFEALYNLAVAQYKLGKLDEAGNNLNTALNVASGKKLPFEDTKASYTLKAGILKVQGRYGELASFLAPVIKNPANPKDPQLLFYYADALLTNKQTIDAIAAFKELIPLEPTNVDYRLRLADAYGAANQADQVKATLEEAQAQADTSEKQVKVFLKYAELQPKVRKDAYSKVVALDPKNTTAHQGLANIYLQERKYKEALVSLVVLQKAQPNNGTIALVMAGAYQNTKQYKLQEQYAKLAVSKLTDKTKQDAYMLLADARYSLKNYKGVVDAYGAVLKLDPNNAVAWYNLSAAYTKLKKSKLAEEALIRAAGLGYAPAQELLKP